MSLDDVIFQYEEELKVFDLVKDNVDVLIDIGCRENYEYAQIKPEVKTVSYTHLTLPTIYSV